MNEPEEKRPSILTASTLIPIGSVIAIGIGLFCAGLKFHEYLNSQFVSLRSEITLLRTGLDQQTANRWTSQDQQVYSLKLQLKNQSVVVPDVDEILRNRK